MLCVHSTKKLADHIMSVGRIPSAHLLNCVCKQSPSEDTGILCKETEDESRYKVVHVVPSVGFSPIRVVHQQFDIKAVQAARRPYVEGVIANLSYRRDASERQEKAEMVRKVVVRTEDGGLITN